MIVKEKYMHTRNYGCRIRKYICDDIRMVSLENQKIKVVFAQDKGADIVELVYKPEDLDYMWHSFNELKNIRHIASKASIDGNFLDSYAGGWQELFPVYGGPADFYGAEMGIHGEACIYPWDLEVIEDTPECVKVKFSLRTIRSPFLLEKTACIREGESSLEIQQKVTNLGSVSQEFMWGHHPAFGWPFLDENTKLYLNGTPTVTVPNSSIGQNCPYDKETKGQWPTLIGKNGESIDMSRACSHEDKTLVKYAISNLQDGKYLLVNEKTGYGIEMEWDLSTFKYLWVWGMYCGHEGYPWFGRAYTMAVEPWSSVSGDFETAKAEGDTLHLDPGESMKTSITARLFKKDSDK